jgi:L-serine dehydratase
MAARRRSTRKRRRRGIRIPSVRLRRCWRWVKSTGKTIAEMKWANETAVCREREVGARLDADLAAMDDCIERGLRMEGELPGGLRVKRRAKAHP